MKTSPADLQRHKDYYAKHRLERIAYSTRWNKENREKRKAIWTRSNNRLSVKATQRKWHQLKAYGVDIITSESMCVSCGANADLVVHHLDGNNGRHGRKLNNSLDNLAILCRSCHPRFHGRWGLKEVVPYEVSA